MNNTTNLTDLGASSQTILQARLSLIVFIAISVSCFGETLCGARQSGQSTLTMKLKVFSRIDLQQGLLKKGNPCRARPSVRSEVRKEHRPSGVYSIQLATGKNFIVTSRNTFLPISGRNSSCQWT
jgi:hypothetical protein